MDMYSLLVEGPTVNVIKTKLGQDCTRKSLVAETDLALDLTLVSSKDFFH